MMEPIILFVDDEPGILRAIKRIFHRSDLKIMTATNANEALSILKELPISVMVSDYSMPEQTGAELLEQARAIRPETVRLILSGNNDQTATIAAINQGRISKFLTKPFDKDDLRLEIDAAVAEWQTRVYKSTTKKILKKTSLLQLIDTEQSQNGDSDSLVVVFGIHELDLLTAQLGNSRTTKLLINIAPSHEQLDDGVSLALMSDGHFCSFIKYNKGITDARDVISSLLDKFECNPVVDGREHSVSFDVGYAVSQGELMDGATLVGNAQSAMKVAQDNQAGRIVLYEQQLTSSRGRLLTLESGLRTALINNEFVLFYQPKIDITNQSLHGAEALIRWNSASLGQVPPFEFIPLTERNGMIDVIGEWVMNEAASQWTSWFPDADSGPAISVNVSAVQLKNVDFIHSLERTLTQHNIPPSLLELELTESLMVDDMSAVIKKLTTIKNLGVKLSIDDFGTGYSSLSYLSHLPVDTIKIDRSFIMQMLDSDEKLAMVRNMIRLGHDLGMQLVAEGVEDVDQLLVLQELGCDITQGYYFSPPVSSNEFIEKSCQILNSFTSPINTLAANSA